MSSIKEVIMTKEADIKALIIDDDDGFREVLTGYLESLGLKVSQSSSSEQGLVEIENNLPDVVFLDVYMPGMNGLELLKLIKEKYPLLKVIVMSGYATEETAQEAIDLGAFDYMNKPIELEDIINILFLVLPQQETQSNQ
jgi:DNA-binding NtrC family response regulator